MSRIIRLAFLGAFLLAFLPRGSLAQEEAAFESPEHAKLVENAMSAAPPAISAEATIMSLDGAVLREGSNGWTCLPDMPDREGNSPMCLDDQWMKFLEAWQNQTAPSYDRAGFGYMLQGGAPESNVDPYAEGPTEDNEWMDEPGPPHIMLVVPDPSILEGLPTDPDNGGPWVMWKDTPLAHVMIPAPGLDM